MVNLNRDFEDALIDPSFAVSPMKPMRFFLDLGTLIGVFPAKRGDKHIFFGRMEVDSGFGSLSGDTFFPATIIFVTTCHLLATVIMC